MNANTNSANTNGRSAKGCSKKFCKVCFDAGKPETVYTNHTVKTMNVRTGKLETTCVTLLALECRYCFTSGHTVKFCPVLKENNNGRKEQEIQHARERHGATASATALEKAVVKKGFALLQEDSDDDEVAPVTVATPVTVAPVTIAVASDEFPALPFNMTAPKVSSVMTFAATAALPPRPKPTKVTFAPAPTPAPTPAPIKEQDLDDDSDYEVNEDNEEPQTPAVSYTDSCFSYRERHGYAEDDSW